MDNRQAQQEAGFATKTNETIELGKATDETKGIVGISNDFVLALTPGGGPNLD